MSIATAERVSETRTSGRAAELAGKYLSFQLGKEEFAIRVTQVREIIGVQEMTHVPQMAAYIKGVINLRGRVIPIISLRLRFGMGEEEYTQRTCIIVVETVNEQKEAIQLGVVVDGVSEVLNLAPADLEEPPDFGSGKTAAYLLGMAKLKGKVKILLDLDCLLQSAEVVGLQALGEAVSPASE